VSLSNTEYDALQVSKSVVERLICLVKDQELKNKYIIKLARLDQLDAKLRDFLGKQGMKWN